MNTQQSKKRSSDDKRRDSGAFDRRIAELQQGFFVNYEKTSIRSELVDGIAHNLGKYLADIKLNSTQLRRFYNDLKELKENLTKAGIRDWTEPTANIEIFKEHLVYVKLLKSKVAYAKGRKTVPAEFEELIRTCIDQINDDPRDFKAFTVFMEAVVGYFYMYAKN